MTDAGEVYVTEVEVWLLSVPTPLSVHVTGELEVRVMELPTVTAGLEGVIAGPEPCGRRLCFFLSADFLSSGASCATSLTVLLNRTKPISRQNNALTLVRVMEVAVRCVEDGRFI